MTGPRLVFCAYDSPRYFAGGPNTWLRRLLPDLRDRGFEVHPLVIHSGDVTECPLVAVLTASGFPVRTLSRQSAPYVNEQVEWLLSCSLEIEPSAFVANLVTPAFYAARWLRQARVPVVGVLHSDALFCDAMERHFVAGDPRNAFHAAVCVSKAIATRVASTNPNEVIVACIPCGAPVPESMSHPEPGTLRVLYVGRITQEAKRVLDVARAFCMAADSLPSCEFTMVGSGPEEGRLREIIDSSSRIRFEGPLSPDEMPAVFARHDVFVLLSDYEGLPIALLEAMASGLVPVCLPISGVSDVIEDGFNGLLVGDRSEGFVAAIKRLSEDSTLLERLRQAARRTVANEYSSDISGGRWAELLNALSAGDAPRRVRVPMHIRLPAPEPAFGSEDLRRPPIRYRLTRACSSAWFSARQQLRPRARLREWRQSIRHDQRG